MLCWSVARAVSLHDFALDLRVPTPSQTMSRRLVPLRCLCHKRSRPGTEERVVVRDPHVVCRTVVPPRAVSHCLPRSGRGRRDTGTVRQPDKTRRGKSTPPATTGSATSRASPYRSRLVSSTGVPSDQSVAGVGSSLPLRVSPAGSDLWATGRGPGTQSQRRGPWTGASLLATLPACGRPRSLPSCSGRVEEERGSEGEREELTVDVGVQ